MTGIKQLWRAQEFVPGSMPAMLDKKTGMRKSRQKSGTCGSRINVHGRRKKDMPNALTP
jgi:hypothetical protein